MSLIFGFFLVPSKSIEDLDLRTGVLAEQDNPSCPAYLNRQLWWWRRRSWRLENAPAATWRGWMYHPLRKLWTQMSPEKGPFQKGKIVFQATGIFAKKTCQFCCCTPAPKPNMTIETQPWMKMCISYSKWELVFRPAMFLYWRVTWGIIHFTYFVGAYVPGNLEISTGNGMDHWDIVVFPLAHDVLFWWVLSTKNEKINLTKEGWNKPTPYPPKFKR